MASPIIRIAHSKAKSGVALYAYAFYPAEALAEAAAKVREIVE